MELVALFLQKPRMDKERPAKALKLTRNRLKDLIGLISVTAFLAYNKGFVGSVVANKKMKILNIFSVTEEGLRSKYYNFLANPTWKRNQDMLNT